MIDLHSAIERSDLSETHENPSHSWPIWTRCLHWQAGYVELGGISD